MYTEFTRYVILRIHGRVQGVFFRHSVKKRANELDICGFVRNAPDGSVYIEAEGEEGALQEFIAWCQEGPPMASVGKVKVVLEKKFEGFTRFEIR